MKVKQAFAILGIVIMVGLYLAALFCALIGTPFARQVLTAALYGTVFVPITLYVFFLAARLLSRKKEEDD